MHKLKSTFIGILLLFSVVFGLAGCQPITKVDSEYEERMNVLLQLIEEYSFYFDEEGITKEQLFEGLLNGIVDAIGDPYSVYLNEEDFKAFMEQVNAKFAGIGVSVAPFGHYVAIINVIPNSPAAEAGLLQGDLIMKIDDEDVYGLTPSEIADKIRGTVGTIREITVSRGSLNDLLTFEMTIREITSPTVFSNIISVGDEEIGYLRVTSFSSNTFDEFKAAIEAFESNATPLTDLIIDVRNNPGGFLHIVMNMLDYLVDSEEPLLHVRNREETVDARHQNNFTTEVDYPIIVLINQNSASASEIFAATLNELNSVPLVGQTTFGKGTMQTTFYLNTKQTVGVKLTTDNWLTPKKQWIQDVGVAPTHEIEMTITNQLFFIDPELQMIDDTVNLYAIPVQSYLKIKGFDVRTDGYIDQKTIIALSNYQTQLESKGVLIPEKGILDSLTIYHINRDIMSIFDDVAYDNQLGYAINELALKN